MSATPTHLTPREQSIKAMKQAVEVFDAAWNSTGLSNPEFKAMNDLKSAIFRETGELFINQTWAED